MKNFCEMNFGHQAFALEGFLGHQASWRWTHSLERMEKKPSLSPQLLFDIFK